MKLSCFLCISFTQLMEEKMTEMLKSLKFTSVTPNARKASSKGWWREIRGLRTAKLSFSCILSLQNIQLGRKMENYFENN